MNGETTVVKDHAHTWEAIVMDGDLYGKTNEIDGHYHEVSIPTANCFAGDVVLETSEVDGHSHEVVLPAELLAHLKGKEMPAEYKAPRLSEDGSDDPYGPDGSDDEEDEMKRRKKAVEEDGLEEKKFQSKMTDKPWDGDRGRFTPEQLRMAVPAAMRAWGDAQAKEKGTMSKSDYKLPYKEPNGTINVNGVRNALSRAKQVTGVPAATIDKAVAELQSVLASAKKAGFACKDEEDEKHYEDNYANLELPPNAERVGNRVIVRNVKVFRTGEWNGQPITDQTLMELNSNFHALKNTFEPPLKAGHDTRVHKLHHGEPAFGHVMDARVVLPYWENDFSFPIDVYANYIDPEKLKARSIEVQQNFARNGKNYGLVMTAVALLGVSTPAVGDLGPIKMPFSRKEEDLLIFEFNDDGGEHMANKDKDQEKEAQAPNTQDFEAKIKEKDEKISTFAAKIKEFEEKAQRDAEEKMCLMAQLRAKDAKAFSDKLLRDGKLLPRDREDFEALYLTLSDETTLTFEDADGKEEKISQLSVFKRLFESREAQVDLDSDKGTVTEDEKKPDTPNPAESNATAPVKVAKEKEYEGLPASVVEYIEKSGLKVKDADVYEAAKKRSDADESVKFEDALAQEYAKKLGR